MITYANANPNSPCLVSAAGVVSQNCADVSIGRRNIEGGGRTSIYQHQNFRFVLGTKGDVLEGWNYDLYGSYYTVNTFQANDNYLDYANAGNALQVTTNAQGAFRSASAEADACRGTFSRPVA